jgi:calcineurin-like phosphoesterase family protein
MQDIFFTSDQHYGHKNIVSGVSEWTSTQRCRQFPTVEAMNKALINGVNNTVGENDLLINLGDWSFGGYPKIWEARQQIKCKNIILIYGNHDHNIENNKSIIDDTDTISYAQDLFLQTAYYKELTLDGIMICMSHYAMRVWNKSHHGSINLHGHSHDTLPYMNIEGQVNQPGQTPLPLALQMDVGVDSAFRILGEYRPFSWAEIKQIMAERSKLLVDHHTPNTN